MKKTALLFLDIYKQGFSSALVALFGIGCRFQPTCSQYAKEAIERFGIKRGTVLSMRRLAKCHPFGGYGSDPVPRLPKP